MGIGLVIAVCIVGWGVWDYFHSEEPSAAAFGTALVGLGATIFLLIQWATE